MLGPGFEAPHIGSERTEFRLDGKRPPRIVDGSGNLAAMADDAGIEQQALDVCLIHGGDLGDIEAVKHFSKAFPLAQDGDPGQPRLETLEADLLEQPRIRRNGATPFAVMIVAIKRIIAGPGATRQAIRLN